jgi:hypothetical protein
MNERIKELVEQTRQNCMRLGVSEATTMGWDELERFAELVRQDYLRELRELKPLAYYDKRFDMVMTAYELGSHIDDDDVPLYALDEVTHD